MKNRTRMFMERSGHGYPNNGECTAGNKVGLRITEGHAPSCPLLDGSATAETGLNWDRMLSSLPKNIMA